MFNYFSFSPSSDYTGNLSLAGSSSSVLPNGTVWQPGDALKLNPNSWNLNESIVYTFDDNFIIEGLKESEMSGLIKLNYIESILLHHGIRIEVSDIANISNSISNDAFKTLSGPCISYCNQKEPGKEIRLGLRTFVLDEIKDSLSNYGIINPRASCFAKVTYMGHTEIIWGVGGTENQYGAIEDVLNGESQSNIEIMIAGELEPKYKVIKKLDPDDPTSGFGPTNEESPLCVGDPIVVVDISNYAEKTDTGWTWKDANYTSNEWYVADVTDPCNDYSNTEITKQLFPIEFISGCDFEDFQPRKLEMPKELDITRITSDSLIDQTIEITWNKPDSVPRTMVMFSDYGKLELPIDFEEFETGDTLKSSEVLYYGGRTTITKTGLTLGQTYQIALLGVNAQYEYSEPLIMTFTLS